MHRTAMLSDRKWERTCLKLTFLKKERKAYLNKYFAHTIQWMGSEGVLRIVQPGKVF